MQVEKTITEEVKAVRQEVSAAIETLVASRTAMEPYPDVEALCEFFQYTQDLASYESLKSGLLEERETEKLAAVHRARENFQKKSARLKGDDCVGLVTSLAGPRCQRHPLQHSARDSLVSRR